MLRATIVLATAAGLTACASAPAAEPAGPITRADFEALALPVASDVEPACVMATALNIVETVSASDAVFAVAGADVTEADLDRQTRMVQAWKAAEDTCRTQSDRPEKAGADA